ncbi:hypothetical protein RD792_002068 [Penstemon davidsonii]|uniref:MADS-box domain-containing protein n=1 Tax=Penstemon davidsonii TaxID=160366 RepID=A0ABR0DQF2_9LAMI|nr:hypothetical protein RD792_002068 [Penstemon davidsonii]
MTRKKVKLAFIANDSARKATFKKRKKGLMKKVSELSTLCGIEACAIVYSPYEPQPDVWPDQRGAHRVVAQFKRMPEMEQSKKMVNQESFIRSRISKAAEQLKKLHKDNREKEITQLMYQCLTGKGLQGLAVAELNDMEWMIDQNLKEISKRSEVLKKGSTAAAAEEKPAVVDLGGGVDRHQQNQWFAELMGSTHGDHHQQQMGGGGGSFGGHGGAGEEVMVQFNDVINNHSAAAAAMWSNAFFP